MQAKLPDQLLAMVRRYGGEYFLASNRESIEKISDTLDKLQSIRRSVKVSADEKEVYYVPLEIAFLCFVLTGFLRFILYRFWRIG